MDRLLPLIALGLLLTGCGATQPQDVPSTDPAADGEPQYGGELIYAMAAETYSLFPGRQPSSTAQDAWLYALEGLVEINEDNEIIPWLATSWEFSEDGRNTTFQLQEGVTFHDGTPFNAEAVAFVFNEALAKNFIYVHMLEGLEEVAADDRFTVTFHFEKPFAVLLSNLSHRSMTIFSRRKTPVRTARQPGERLRRRACRGWPARRVAAQPRGDHQRPAGSSR